MASGRPSIGTRRIGYVVLIFFDALFLVVANNLLAWGWFPWLTADFELVLPAINTVLVVGAVVNLVYLFHDPVSFKTILDVVVLPLNLYAGIRMWQVFPFDFSAYAFDWGLLVRLVIAMGILGTGIGIIVGIVNIVRQVAVDPVRG